MGTEIVNTETLNGLLNAIKRLRNVWDTGDLEGAVQEVLANASDLEEERHLNGE